jgi:hypothetical protein
MIDFSEQGAQELTRLLLLKRRQRRPDAIIPQGAIAVLVKELGLPPAMLKKAHEYLR